MKKDVAGNIVHYKAWLVAQGFSQIGRIDYDNTYAPVGMVMVSEAHKYIHVPGLQKVLG